MPFVDASPTSTPSRKRRSTSLSRSASPRTTCRSAWTACCTCRCWTRAAGSYGITNYRFAIIQLAQTTLRSEIGKIDLDRTFEERTPHQCECGQRARQGFRGVGREGAALRDQEHQPAEGRPAAMEKQMRAEREKRAVVLPPKASATRRSTRPKARSSGSSRHRRRTSSSRSTRPRARPRPSSR